MKFSRFLKPTTQWLEQQQTSILSAAIIITVANFGSSLSGLIRQRLLITKFFDTPQSQEAFEALLVAFQIPDILFQLIVLGALSAAFIPVFTTIKKQYGKDTAFEMSSVVISILLVVFFLASSVVFVFAEPLTRIRTGDAFTPEQITIATNLTRMMLFAQGFFAISSFFSAMLQSFHRFIIPSIAPILYNIGIVIGVFLLYGQLGVYSAGVGVIIGAFLHMIVQLPLVLKIGYRPTFSLRTTAPGVKKLFSLMPARVVTLGVGEVQNLSLGFFATSLGNLSFVVIRLATTLVTLPIRLFGVPISQASLPFLSKESDDKNLETFKNLITQSLNQIAFFAFPASVLILILRIPIVRLVFGAKNFPWETTVLTGWAVAIISVSIGAQAMVQLMIRAFHALKNTTTPLIITTVTVVSYVVGCFISINYTSFGVLGIAGVTSATALLEVFLFMFFLQKTVPVFLSKSFILSQLKMITASFLLAVSLYLPFRVLDQLVFNTTKTVELIALTLVTGTIGMLVYIYFAVLFRIEELSIINKLLDMSVGKWKRSANKTTEVFIEHSMEDDFP
ncbi:MAG: murein biosynthesis integral membrane protein MurJ [Pseudomonadales bacterium]|nr:murein biosynthesis integral membrane protein MurJ [Pseudomonadales bacterium]